MIERYKGFLISVSPRLASLPPQTWQECFDDALLEWVSNDGHDTLVTSRFMDDGQPTGDVIAVIMNGAPAAEGGSSSHSAPACRAMIGFVEEFAPDMVWQQVYVPAVPVWRS